ncbi:Acetylpolyamine aminohydrolase [Grifola frondosa]|uniref:Acetylpolyamine aminohydrolase n=1 Tax=Grifola frondosa TaxID=5627 RepID=A0A1C7LME6_GRIFR|nr:Acetylpolyamine aminohydrolase [Grifola frondosa]
MTWTQTPWASSTRRMRRDYVKYVENIYQEWIAIGGEKSAVLPETFFHRALTSEEPPATLSPIAKAGLYCFDLSGPITAETYRSAVASVLVALSAAKALLSEKALTRSNGVFALTRPPGHHAGVAVSGGYCFFNNAAVATKYLLHSSDDTTVTILDIDYHHGNGTQQIFYSEPRVLYVSLHADGDYPYFTGSTKERGAGEGVGFNHNLPLPRNTTGDDLYCETLLKAVAFIRVFDPAYLIVSLGVDTAADDPICDFLLSRECYTRIGEIIASVKKPTLFTMEGGYHLESIGGHVSGVLVGFNGAH